MDRISRVSTANTTASGWTEGPPLSTEHIPEDSSHDLNHRGSRVCNPRIEEMEQEEHGGWPSFNPRTEEMEAGGRNVEASQFVIPG